MSVHSRGSMVDEARSPVKIMVQDIGRVREGVGERGSGRREGVVRGRV